MHPTYPKENDLSENFGRWEMECRDGCGLCEVDEAALMLLQKSRTTYGKPMKVTSACRCEKSNRLAGGAKSSSHLCRKSKRKKTTAFDIYCEDDEHRANLLPVLMTYFPRVYIYGEHIHVDNDLSKPYPRVGLRDYRKPETKAAESS